MQQFAQYVTEKNYTFTSRRCRLRGGDSNSQSSTFLALMSCSNINATSVPLPVFVVDAARASISGDIGRMVARMDDAPTLWNGSATCANKTL